MEQADHTHTHTHTHHMSNGPYTQSEVLPCRSVPGQAVLEVEQKLELELELLLN